MSRAAGWLARPLCRAKDPLSGFFALRTDLPARAPSLSPLGYKIGLEIMVRCRVRRPAEVPIHFADRRLGQSKLTLAEQFRFLRHLARLWRFRLGLDATRRVPVC
jgi:dolichol-phosphate mannosyltransferase